MLIPTHFASMGRNLSIRGEESDKDALSSPIIPYHKKHCHITPILNRFLQFSKWCLFSLYLLKKEALYKCFIFLLM